MFYFFIRKLSWYFTLVITNLQKYHLCVWKNRGPVILVDWSGYFAPLSASPYN